MLRDCLKFELSLQKWLDSLSGLDNIGLARRFKLLWRVADLSNQLLTNNFKILRSSSNRDRLQLRTRQVGIVTALDYQFQIMFNPKNGRVGYFHRHLPEAYQIEHEIIQSVHAAHSSQCDIILDLIILHERHDNLLLPCSMVQLWLNLVDTSLDVNELMEQFRVRMTQGVNPSSASKGVTVVTQTEIETLHVLSQTDLETANIPTQTELETVESCSQTALTDDVRTILHHAGMLEEVTLSLTQMQQLVRLIAQSTDYPLPAPIELDVNFIVDSSMEVLLSPSTRVMDYLTRLTAPLVTQKNDQLEVSSKVI